MAASYVSGVLRLTLLAPGIVEAILDGRQPVELQLDYLLAGFPWDWAGQHSRLIASKAVRLYRTTGKPHRTEPEE